MTQHEHDRDDEPASPRPDRLEGQASSHTEEPFEEPDEEPQPSSQPDRSDPRTDDEPPDRRSDPTLDRTTGNPGGPPPTDREALDAWSRQELLEHADDIGIEVPSDASHDDLVDRIHDA